MEVAAIVSVVASGVSTVVSYIGAQRQAQSLDYAAQAKRQEGEVQAQLDVNDTVAETDALSAQRQQTIFNQKLAASVAAEKRDALAKDIADKRGSNYLKLDKSARSFADVFKAEIDREEDKLASFDFQAGQESYSYYKQAEEIDRKASYAYSQGMAKRDYTLAKFNNEASALESEAANTRFNANVNLLTGIATTGASYATLGTKIGQGAGFKTKVGKSFFRYT
jgi:hypothetical protein